MTRISRGVAIGAALAAAGLAVASPASAEPPSGSFNAVVNSIEGPSMLTVGQTLPASFTPCGADCTAVTMGTGMPNELHPQGPLWAGVTTLPGGTTVTSSLDPATWTLTQNLVGATMVFSLTRI